MSDLRFTRVAVRRMPGIADPFELRDLAMGLNIVFGPNASGKTTTARSLEALLWPGVAPSEAWLEGNFEVAGQTWWIELDGRRVRYQRDGQESGAPHSFAEEVRYRYHLPLHTLLDAEDRGFAKAITLESAGGYDLNAAAQILEPKRQGGYSRPRTQQDALKAAQEKLQRSRSAQERLQIAAASLREDEARVAGRVRLEQRRLLLQTALDHAERSRGANAAAHELSAFHPAVERLAGDEGERLSRLREQRSSAAEALAVAERGRAAAQSELESIGLGAAAVEDGSIRSAASALSEVDRIASDHRAAENALAQVRQKVRAEASRLGIGDPEEVKAFTPERLGQLAEAADRLSSARAARAALEAELEALESGTVEGDAATLARGIYLLEQWLRSAPPSSGEARSARFAAVVGAAVLLVAGVALALLVHPAALLLSLIGAVLLVPVLRRVEGGDPRADIRQEYEDVGIQPAPNRWESAEVRAAADALARQLNALRLDEEIQARRGPLEQRLDAARGREADALETLRPVADSFGISEAASISVSLLIDRVGKLLELDGQLRSCLADVERLRKRLDEAIKAANAKLEALDQPPAADATALRVTVEELERRRDLFLAARGRLEKADEAIRYQGEAVQTADEGIEQLARHLDVDSVDPRQLAEWLGDRERMLAVRRRYEGLDSERQRLAAALQEMHGFEPSLLNPQPDALRAEATEIDVQLEQLEVLRDRVTELRQEVRIAQQGHEVEDALDDLDRATLALREIRDRDAAGFVAAELIRFVEEESRNQHRPEVFHRASRLFATITRGRYELRLDDEAGQAAFRAWDTERQRTQPLEELSSATRVQLLLAVRIAFVEVQEKGISLPLLLDETLANSDPERSAAIMDAMLTLGEKGRQIFYFTAQPDEVRRWRDAIAERGDLAHRVIDLAEARRAERSLDPESLDRVTAPPISFPHPNGDSHRDYGDRLRVPAVRPHFPPGALHLWYLVEDPADLHRIMETLAIETWGSFQGLLEAGGSEMLDAALVEHVKRLGLAAESALDRLRIGRGRRVDRHALEASGAVSENFIDEVAALNESLGGDGEALMEAIDDRAVPRFLHAKADALREYLEAEGYIDSRAPLRPELIRLEVLRDMGLELGEGGVDLNAIERLLVRLGVVVRRETEEVQGDLGL